MSADKIMFNESSISSLSADLYAGGNGGGGGAGGNSMDNNSSTASNLIENQNDLMYQNLITYELHRSNTNIGFGFDLKGDKPAMVGSVRKGSIADQAGLREGDLVVSINNKKVTDLDHDQVVRLVGLTKRTLILQVTKVKYLSQPSSGLIVNTLKQQHHMQQQMQIQMNYNKIRPSSKKLSRKFNKQTVTADQIRLG